VEKPEGKSFFNGGLMAQRAGFCAVFGCGLGHFKRPLLTGGRKFEESKGTKIVNTIFILPDWYGGFLLW
jgi:hypothetical protein